MKSLELKFNTHGKLKIQNTNFKIRKDDRAYLVNEMKKLFEKTPAYSGLRLNITFDGQKYNGELSLFSGTMQVTVSAERRAITVLFDDLNYKLNYQLTQWLQNRFKNFDYRMNRSIA